jgi:hypothetical protein
VLNIQNNEYLSDINTMTEIGIYKTRKWWTTMIRGTPVFVYKIIRTLVKRPLSMTMNKEKYSEESEYSSVFQ